MIDSLLFLRPFCLFPPFFHNESTSGLCTIVTQNPRSCLRKIFTNMLKIESKLFAESSLSKHLMNLGSSSIQKQASIASARVSSVQALSLVCPVVHWTAPSGLGMIGWKSSQAQSTKSGGLGNDWLEFFYKASPSRVEV